MRDSGRADRELPELLRLQAAGLPLGDAWTFGHVTGYRTGVLLSPSPVVLWCWHPHPRRRENCASGGSRWSR
jgi:hypothetical protein